MRPALFVTGTFLFIRQAAMREAHQRPAGFVDQIDLDQTRAGRHFLLSFPAEAISEAMNGNDLGEVPTRRVLAADIDEIDAAGMGFGRRRPEPAQDLVGVGEEGEDRRGRCRDLDLAPKHQLFSHGDSP
jgi:hypothetical protein